MPFKWYNFCMDKVDNKIGQDFSVFQLAKFGLPAFFMNVFAQVFRSLDDGLFISRYVGENALASLNLINPIAGILLAITHLFSLGASNISARLMGENKQLEAKQVFSRVVISGFVIGTVFAIIINVFSKPILIVLGADDTLIDYAIYQLRIVYLFAPITLVNSIFSCYYSTAGKPKMGLLCSIINGVTNITLDVFLIVICKMGVIGASIATVCGDLAVFFVGIIFYTNKKNEIYLVKANGKYFSTSIESASYALPQCINALSFSITALLTNKVILILIGSTGVAVNAIVSDIRKILTSGLVGFAACVGPVIAYNFGSKNIFRLKKILKEIFIIWLTLSLILTTCGLILRKPLINIFMSDKNSDNFYNIAFIALSIEIFGTLFVSGSITLSRSFIALNQPKLATILSVFRNLVFKVIVYLTLPFLIKDIGIWLAQPIGEGIAFIFGIYLVFINKNKILPEVQHD